MTAYKLILRISLTNKQAVKYLPDNITPHSTGSSQELEAHMKITILGSGAVGSSLGKGWSRHGHQITYGSRNPQSESMRSLLDELPASQALNHQQALEISPVVVLATPWKVTKSLLTSLNGWQDKILIDTTNPLAPGLQLEIGFDTSGAEQVSYWAPGARVVKAFNTTGANNMLNPTYQGKPISMFICGDDPIAKELTSSLCQDIGFVPIDTGPLTSARYLEPMALLWIQLANAQDLGREFAFNLVMR